MSKSSAPKSTVSDTTELSYEQAVLELERLVAGMESGQWPLDQLLENYKRGAELLGLCRQRLQAVEQQVRILDGEGLKPWGEG